MGRFTYVAERISDAEFETEPFRHLFIRDLLTEVDFKEVTQSEDVLLPAVSTVTELFDQLERVGYEVIEAPGCTTSRREYERWLEKSQRPRMTHDACEGEGMTLRLRKPRNDAVQALDQFFKSEQLHDVLVEKFGLSEPTNLDAGLQKYLHGYEISPHPDNRQKALTWMLNINPQSDSEDLEIHTYFLRLRPEWSFVKTFWQGNPQADTCWVPWEWCDTVKRQPDNNSVVIFAPSYDTLHAVRAHYDHLAGQRTQYYGNLWYEFVDLPQKPQFADFQMATRRNVRLSDFIRSPRKSAIKFKKRTAVMVHSRGDAWKR